MWQWSDDQDNGIMSIRTKSRRKIIVEEKPYIWYIAPDNETADDLLHIASEDKKMVLSIPLGKSEPYVISKGKYFQRKETSGKWERYSLPISIPDVITPAVVEKIIRWAEDKYSVNDER